MIEKKLNRLNDIKSRPSAQLESDTSHSSAHFFLFTFDYAMEHSDLCVCVALFSLSFYANVEV